MNRMESRCSRAVSTGSLLMDATMRRSLIAGANVLAALMGFSGSALAQSAQALPIPGYEAAKDLPGEKELPDPNLTYKVVFDIAKAAGKVDEVNPGLIGVARYVNTLAKHGVSSRPSKDRRRVPSRWDRDRAEQRRVQDTQRWT